MTTPKERPDLGFGVAFNETDPSDWPPEKSTISNDRKVPQTDQIKQLAEESGFHSRQPAKKKPKPVKEPMDQINFRAKISSIEGFRAICNSQEPAWPMGYTFGRALAALQRELSEH